MLCIPPTNCEIASVPAGEILLLYSREFLTRSSVVRKKKPSVTTRVRNLLNIIRAIKINARSRMAETESRMPRSVAAFPVMAEMDSTRCVESS